MTDRNKETMHAYILSLAQRIADQEEEHRAQCDAITSMITNGYPVKHIGSAYGNSHSLVFSAPVFALTEKDRAIFRAYAEGEDILVMLLGRD